MVNLMFGWWSSRYKISISHLFQKTLSIQGLNWYGDPLDTRSRSHAIRWPAGSWSTLCLKWWSSRYKIYISGEDSWSSWYKISISHLFQKTLSIQGLNWYGDPLDTRSRSPVKICSPLVLRRSRLQSHIFLFCNKWHMTLSPLYKVKVNYMFGCITLSSLKGQGYDATFKFSCHCFKNHVMVCGPFVSVQGPTSLFFQHVTVRDPLLCKGLNLTLPFPILQTVTSLLGNDPDAWIFLFLFYPGQN